VFKKLSLRVLKLLKADEELGLAVADLLSLDGVLRR